MFIPPNFNEQEVLGTINKVLDVLAPSFSFGYYDAEDMRQEGFIFASQALPFFDPDNESGCSLETFLRLHIRNRFLNLRRDKMHRHTPPCLSCAHYEDSKCVRFADKTECKKWAKWARRNQAKRSLVESGDATALEHTLHSDADDVFTHVSTHELVDYLSERIPMSLRADYKRLLEGAPLKKSKREALLETLRTLLGELTDGREIAAWTD